MTHSARLLSGFLCLSVVLTAMSTTQADDQWITYEGGEGPGKGKHIVFVSGDDEYRSEEACPQLAKILSLHHGFKCTVLFAIDDKGEINPAHQTNIPGTHFLNDADMMVVFLRFRHLPDEQMKPIDDFTKSGKPMMGLRTATHSFNYRNMDSPYAKWHWRSKEPQGGWGQAVLGDTWISHHGHHKKEATRGVVEQANANHPILTGVGDVFGLTDVYGIVHLRDDDAILMRGSVLTGMKPTDPPVEGKKNNPMMPLVWTRMYKGEAGKTSRVVSTTMGASVDLESEGLRRLLVNGCFWGLQMDVPEKAKVDIVGEFKPTMYGFGTFQKGLKPSDFALRK